MAILRALSLIAAALTISCGARNAGAPSEGTTAEVARGAHAFKNERGESVSLNQYRGSPFVLTAIYTSCSVRCPLTISKLEDIDAALRKQGRIEPFVLVTLDPRTDTPERLGRFKASHSLPSNFHLITGNDADTRELLTSMGVSVARDDGHIDHDVRIVFFDAHGARTKSFDGWSFDPNDAIQTAAAPSANGKEN